MKTVWAIVSLCITLPIWYFLMYTILSALHVDRLVWFLFWVYLPLSFLMAIIEKTLLKVRDE